MDPTKIRDLTEQFRNQIRDLEGQLGMVAARIAELEQEHNVLIHQMERPDCKYRERARIATELQRVRQERRQLKDWQHNMKPLSEYIYADRGRNLQTFSGSYLGAARQAVKNQERCAFTV